MAVSYSELLDKLSQQGFRPNGPGNFADPGQAVGFGNQFQARGNRDSDTQAWLSHPENYGKWWLSQPQNAAMIAAQQSAANRASQSYVANYSGQREALKKQRAAAAEMRAIQKAQYEHQLSTGLRDIQQGRETGLKGAINNALQRGIFRSGIKLENQSEVNRESDEAKSDLQQQIDDALALLTQQGISQEAGYDSQLASYAQAEAASRHAAAQQQAAFDASSMFSLDDLATTLTEGDWDRIDLYGTTDPSAPKSGGVVPVNTGGGGGGGTLRPT